MARATCARGARGGRGSRQLPSPHLPPPIAAAPPLWGLLVSPVQWSTVRGLAWRRRRGQDDAGRETGALAGQPLALRLGRVYQSGRSRRGERWQFHPMPHEKRYVSSEAHLYLGRQYRLKIHSVALESVKLTGGYLHVATAHGHDALQMKLLLNDWYRHHARDIFHTYLLRWLEAAPSLQMPSPAIMRCMPRR
jgi:hypothetical protein